MRPEGALGNVGAPPRAWGMCRSGAPGEKPSEPSRVAWSWALAGSAAEDHPKGSANAGPPKDPEQGRPQGGGRSPLVANLFRHEVLEAWDERDVRPRMNG
jgi:hypothetical protein